ncbi:hypothetical protein TRICI_001347 [Trichomonascus ciferrii]|uniref:Uncharacterized protein n=1 Tax=Trichomonascus ciferrii TaxID=44093 RepID=A0A642VCM9_9ASCO|nr:hypothetical protein TRICI_001347 [Trichomonascus ciferrii]
MFRAVALRWRVVRQLGANSSRFHNWNGNGLWKKKKSDDGNKSENSYFEELKKRNESYSEELGDYTIDPITLRRQALPKRRPGDAFTMFPNTKQNDGYRWFVKSAKEDEGGGDVNPVDSRVAESNEVKWKKGDGSFKSDGMESSMDSVSTKPNSKRSAKEVIEPVDSQTASNEGRPKEEDLKGEEKSVPPEEEHYPADVGKLAQKANPSEGIALDESMKVCGMKEEHSPLADIDGPVIRQPFAEAQKEKNKPEHPKNLEHSNEEHSPLAGAKPEHLEQQTKDSDQKRPTTSEMADPTKKVCGSQEEHSPLADSTVASSAGEPSEHTPLAGTGSDEISPQEIEELKKGETPGSNKPQPTAPESTPEAGFENIVDSRAVGDLDAKRDLYPNLKGEYKDHGKTFEKLYDFMAQDPVTTTRKATATQQSEPKFQSTPRKVSKDDIEVAEMFPEDIRKKYDQSSSGDLSSKKPSVIRAEDIARLDDAMKGTREKLKQREEEQFRAKNAYDYSWEKAYAKTPYSLDSKNFFSSVSQLEAEEASKQSPTDKEYAILTPSLKTIYTKTLPFRDERPPQDLFSTLSTMDNPGKYVKAISKLEKNGWTCIGGGGPGELLVFERLYSPEKRYNGLLIKLTTSFIGIVGIAVILMSI